jgi:hAT family dimerisation domain.
LLARDILSIPATGAGVERLFNTARDICHYRRGRMKSETIQELMMYLCTSRFELEVQEAKELERFFSLDEIEALREEKDERPEDVEIESISDTEEQTGVSENLIDVDHDDDDDNDFTATAIELPLPELIPRPRTSGRKRKIPADDEFESY